MHDVIASDTGTTHFSPLLFKLLQGATKKKPEQGKAVASGAPSHATVGTVTVRPSIPKAPPHEPEAETQRKHRGLQAPGEPGQRFVQFTMAGKQKSTRGTIPGLATAKP